MNPHHPLAMSDSRSLTPDTTNDNTRELRGKVEYVQTRHEKFGRLLKAPGANSAADPAFKELYGCESRRVRVDPVECLE